MAYIFCFIVALLKFHFQNDISNIFKATSRSYSLPFREKKEEELKPSTVHKALGCVHRMQAHFKLFVMFQCELCARYFERNDEKNETLTFASWEIDSARFFFFRSLSRSSFIKRKLVIDLIKYRPTASIQHFYQVNKVFFHFFLLFHFSL